MLDSGERIDGRATRKDALRAVAWSTRRELAVVALVFFAQVVVLMTFPIAAARAGLSPATTGLLLSAYGATSLVADIPAAAFSDIVGRRPVVLAGGVVLVVGAVALAAGGRESAYLVGLLLVGISLALLVSPSLAHLTEVGDVEDQALIQGANGSGQAAASIAAVLLAGGFLAWSGPTSSFGLVVVAGIVIVVLAAGIRDRARRSGAVSSVRWLWAGFGSAVRVMRAPPVRLATTLAVAYGIVFLVLGNGFTPPFALTLGISPLVIGILLALRTVVVLVVSPTFGAAVSRFGSTTPVIVTTALGAAGLALVAVAAVFPLVLVAAMFLQGLAIAYSAAAANIWVSEATDVSSRAVGIATSNLGSRGALLVTPPVFGVSAQFVHPAAPFLVGGILMVVVALVMARLAGDVGRATTNRPDNERDA